jgi:hypothetical protein
MSIPARPASTAAPIAIGRGKHDARVSTSPRAGVSDGGLLGRVALGNIRWAVPKTAGRISMGKVELGVTGLPTDPARRLWLKPEKNTRHDPPPE